MNTQGSVTHQHEDSTRYVTWSCIHCGNWERSKVTGTPPVCAACNVDMTNRDAELDGLAKQDLNTFIPY